MNWHFLDLIAVGSIVLTIALIVVTSILYHKANKIDKLEAAELKAKKEQEQVTLQNKISD